MSERKPIRKIEVSVDRKFPTTIEYGKVEGMYYILHTVSRHWDENLFLFTDEAPALVAMGLAAANLAMGLETPRSFEGTCQVQLKF